MAAVIENSSNLFSSRLEGNRVALPFVIPHIRDFLSDGASPPALRTSSLAMLGSATYLNYACFAMKLPEPSADLKLIHQMRDQLQSVSTILVNALISEK